MTVADGIIVGFFIGSICSGLFCVWFIKYLKKTGRIKFEATEKILKELEEIK